MTKRTALLPETYSPVFKGPIEGWVVNYTKSHFWRVSASMEWVDVMQDAYLVFMRVAQRYPDMDTPQHFMALFKISWVNHMTDLANLNTKLKAMGPEPTVKIDGDAVSFEPMGETDNEGKLAVMLRQAPPEVKMVLTLFLNAPQELLDTVLVNWKGRDKRHANGGSGRICAALGLPKDCDVMGIVENYLRN